MSKIVKAQLVSGRPIVLDFKIGDEWISYEAICPKCYNKVFVISEDKSRIACTNSVCFAIIFVRPKETKVDMDKISWDL